MNTNIYDTANQLERELRSFPAYIEVKEAMEEIRSDETTYALFQEFQTATFDLQQLSEEPSEDKIKEVQSLYSKVVENPAIKKLMDNEQQLSLLVEDINQIITKPIQEIYQAPTE